MHHQPHPSPPPTEVTEDKRNGLLGGLIARPVYPGRSTAARLQFPLLTAHLGTSDVGNTRTGKEGKDNCHLPLCS